MIYMVYGKLVEVPGVHAPTAASALASMTLVGAIRWWPITYATNLADVTRVLDALNAERDKVVAALTGVWDELDKLAKSTRARDRYLNNKRYDRQRDALLAREAKLFEEHAAGMMDPYFPCGGRELVMAVKYDKLAICEDARSELSRQTLLLQRATLFGHGQDENPEGDRSRGEGLSDDGQYDTPDF